MKKLISILTVICLIGALTACGSNKKNNNATNPPVQTGSPAPVGTTTPMGTTDTNKNNGTGITTTETLKIGKADHAAHGTKGFCTAVAVLQGDTIVSAIVDEYQVMAKAEATCVPNSDGDFGNYFTDKTSGLASKRTNSTYYSGLMEKTAKATVPINKSFDAIADYAIGKTVAELEAELSKKDKDKYVDAVSGSTLVDTKGYLEAILQAAKNAQTGANQQNTEKTVNDTNGNNNPSGIPDNNSDLSNGKKGVSNGTTTPNGTTNTTTPNGATVTPVPKK